MIYKKTLTIKQKSMQHLILALALLISSIIFAQTSTEKTENGISVNVSSVNALSDKGTVKFGSPEFASSKFEVKEEDLTLEIKF